MKNIFITYGLSRGSEWSAGAGNTLKINNDCWKNSNTKNNEYPVSILLLPCSHLSSTQYDKVECLYIVPCDTTLRELDGYHVNRTTTN